MITSYIMIVTTTTIIIMMMMNMVGIGPQFPPNIFCLCLSYSWLPVFIQIFSLG